MNLDQLIGTQVTLRGIAEDDAAGAVVELDSGRCIYVAGRSGWGRDRGKRIEITGKLDRRHIGPVLPAPDDGLATHGMVGKRFILDGATWKLEP